MKKPERLTRVMTYNLDSGLTKNTKANISELGEITLAYVSYRDTIEFTSLLKQEISDKDFVVKVLLHQIVEPKLNFQAIASLSDAELEELARIFVDAEDYLFRQFKDTGNLYSDFRNAIKLGNEKQIAELNETLKSLRETLNRFHEDYAPFIMHALDYRSSIQKSLVSVTKIADSINQKTNHYVNLWQSAIDQSFSMAKVINESLRPQIDFWQQWADQNKKVFASYSSFWTEFQHKYNIAEEEAARVLRKYKWFITPSMPITIVHKVVMIDKEHGRKDAIINRLFVNYFSANNWRNLEIMVKSWKKNYLLEKRHKILADCVETLKHINSKHINVTNVILPTLITQIDGAITDYLSSKNIQWETLYDDKVNKKTGKVTSKGRKTQLRKAKRKILSDNLDDLANDIFLNILFQKSQPGKPLETPFNFNRHKIIHGETTKYGRNTYMIRAFMILDMLAHF